MLTINPRTVPPSTVDHELKHPAPVQPTMVPRVRCEMPSESLNFRHSDQWRWTRADCATYLEQVFGEPFERSCCTFCPFTGATAGSRAELIQRWHDQPAAGASSIALEYTALALNPRIGAFGVGATAMELAAANDLTAALDIARRTIDDTPVWDLIEVRRIFHAKAGDPTAKGDSWRSVAVTATGSRMDMLTHLHSLTDVTVETDQFGVTRAWCTRLSEGVAAQYPMTEWMWVVVPHGVRTKKRPGFEQRWATAHTSALF